jgi:hypothetical protein
LTDRIVGLLGLITGLLSKNRYFWLTGIFG